MKRLILALALGVSLCAPAVAQMGQIPAFVTPAPSAPTKSYTMIGANDVVVTSSATVADFPVTMTGTAGRLIWQGASNGVAISSVIFDAGGANQTTLNLDYGPVGSYNEVSYSANVPAASGSKNIQVTYSSNILDLQLSGISWLATGLTLGFDSGFQGNAFAGVSLTVNSGDFIFATNFSPVVGAISSANWSSGSTQAPTGSRLSNTSLSQGNQYSASADWASPSAGSFTIGTGSSGNGDLFGATYK